MFCFSLLICIGIATVAHAGSSVTCPPVNPNDAEAQAECKLFKCAEIHSQEWTVKTQDFPFLQLSNLTSQVTMPATDVLPLCFTYKLTPALDGVTAGTITVGMALIGTTNSLSLKTPSARIAHNVDADSTGVQVKLSTAGFFDATKLAEEKFKPFGNPWSTQAASFYFSSSKPTKDTQIAITASIDCTKSDCTGYLNAGMKFAVYAAVQDDLCTTDCSRMGCSGTKCDEFGHCTNTAMYRCENKDNSTNPNAAAFTAAGVALPVAAMTMMNML